MKWVYFIQGEGGGPVKIGKATNFADRIKNIQAMSPVKLRILGLTQEWQENQIHRKFQHLRLHGEWFTPDGDLLEFAANCERPPTATELAMTATASVETRRVTLNSCDYAQASSAKARLEASGFSDESVGAKWFRKILGSFQ